MSEKKTEIIEGEYAEEARERLQRAVTNTLTEEEKAEQERLHKVTTEYSAVWRELNVESNNE